MPRTLEQCSGGSSLVERIDQLKLGESCSNNLLTPVDKVIEVLIDVWKFKRKLLEYSIVQKLVVTITKIDTCMVSVVLEYCADSLKEIFALQNWITIRCKEQVTRSQVLMHSRFNIANNNRDVTIFNQSLDHMMTDVQENKTLLTFQMDMNVRVNFDFLVDAVYSSSGYNQNTSSYHVPLPDYNISIATHILKLTKPEVAFLIGCSGARIKSIREESNATIKVLPISNKLAKRDLNKPSNIRQSITVSGDLYSVALTMATIDSHLKLYRISPNIIL